MIRAFTFLLLSVLIWGAQPLFVKIVLRFFSVGFTGFARSAVAALLFGLIALLSKPPPVASPSAGQPRTGRARLWLLIGGMGMGLGNLFWNASLTRTTVGACSVLQVVSMVVLVLYGVFVLRERCNTIRALGLAGALGGMFMVSWNGQDLSALASSRYFHGNMLALASGLSWGMCAIAQKVTVPGRTGAAVVAPIFAVSALMCGAAALSGPALLARFNGVMLAVLIITGAVGMGLGNMLFTEAMRTISASAAAASLAVCPLVSLAAASAILHEPVSGYLIAGAPLTCVGVAAAIAAEPAPSPLLGEPSRAAGVRVPDQGVTGCHGVLADASDDNKSADEERNGP